MSNTRYTHADQIFRVLLKEARIGKKLTQIDVAKRLGVPQSYVSKYESGERRLDFVETVQVCDALNIKVADFATSYLAKMDKPRRGKSTNQ